MQNRIYQNDNLCVMRGMNSRSVDLIYLDPPFNSQRMYRAKGSASAGAGFKDIWRWQDGDDGSLAGLEEEYSPLVGYIHHVKQLHSPAMAAYLLFMAQRIIEMHRILKDTGSMYLHCDPTASHYLKVVCDYIFGAVHFKNEIIWFYRKYGRAGKNFKRNHDILFWYAKNVKEMVFNPQYEDFSPKTIKAKYGRKSVDGKVVQDKSVRMHEVRRKEGVAMGNVWEISIIHPISAERTGYPTQKPLKLLHRIIQASSVEGDVVLDPFCGCATTCVAAEQLNRHWIGIDVDGLAAKWVVQRLSTKDRSFGNFVSTTKAPQRTDL